MATTKSKTKEAPDKTKTAAASKTASPRTAATKKKTSTSSKASSQTTTDHDQIRSWAEQRKGKPAMVKGTDDKNGSGILRIDFPGYSGKDTLEEISWEDFFKKFDDSKLEFLYQDKTSTGKESRFNKFVSK